jgi:GAF domain-containing protein
MSELQRVIETLLLATGASRALLQLRRDGAEPAIAAEAVQHGQPQLRHDAARAAAAAGPDAPPGVKAQMVEALSRDGQSVGIVALHDCVVVRQWSEREQAAMREAQVQILKLLQQPRSAADELRAAAIEAVLGRLRRALDVQRCTFRQPVQAAYAFPVTFESKHADVRSLLGDFTIVQTGQPVIVKLLAERAQVIQEDCSIASQNPLFHKMLAHYGGMRAQMVTPHIVGDALRGVLSVHELRHPRVWTADEKAWAAQAAALIGAIADN